MDSSDIDPSGRVSLVRAGDMRLPASCAMCGKGSYNVDENFLDIKLDIPDFGTVYFCNECGQEIGFAAGCARSNDFEALSMANEQLTEENEKYEGMLERLGNGLERDILAWLDNRGINLPSSSGASVPSVDTSESPEKDDGFLYGDFGTSDSTDEQSVGGSASESTDDAESVTVEGSNDPDESPSIDSKSESEPAYQPSIEL